MFERGAVMTTDDSLASVWADIKQRTAIHESGHAVMALSLGWGVEFIEVSKILDPATDVDLLVHEEASWAFARIAIPASKQHDINGLCEVLGGYASELLCAPAVPGEVPATPDDVVSYVESIREDNGERFGDLQRVWELLEFNFDLPNHSPSIAVEQERNAAFEWAIRYACDKVPAQRDAILAVAAEVLALAPGQRLSGDRIVELASGVRQ